ncbi:MAG: aminopeptidase [Thermoplasmatota archaeon]
MAATLLEQGARNAVQTCLAVRPGENVILVSDLVVKDVGDALEAALRDAKARVSRVTLDRPDGKPMTRLPAGVEALAAAATVSIWAAASMPGELPLRMDYRKLVKHARHAHMPGVTRLLMETGMAADYNAVADLTKRVAVIAKPARTARVEGKGTHVTVEFNRDWRWLLDTGLLHSPGSWGNLPAGEIYTAPFRLDGTISTPLLGDWLSERFGLQDPPITFEVKESRVVLDSIRGGKAEARDAFRTYLQTEPNSSRAGEFAVGTNIGLKNLIGNLLQDEKFPGVHIAFGHPYAEETGAPWTCKTHIDVILPGVSLWLDDRQVLDNGRFVI